MAVEIKTFREVEPTIYAYQTPGIPSHNGWTKIGYTERKSAEERIYEQTHTADIEVKLCWEDFARYKVPPKDYFTDHDFHNFLVKAKGIERKAGTEWFHIEPDEAEDLFREFAKRQNIAAASEATYTLRAEQLEAVEKTLAYFKDGGAEFLWNAKPRFGKTLSAYDLAARAGYKKILIVTNRPSIANSWLDDFNKFIGWKYKLAFVSETDALSGKSGVLSRDDYVARAKDYEGMVAFESLQGLKGSIYFGGTYDKLSWMAKGYRDRKSGEWKKGIEFDLLIVDESHEGVDTMKTERAFENIARKHTLYLSGTPFKALADGRFSEEQIYNWSYADEQEAKASWSGEDYNPYERLPRLAMFTYQLSDMIIERAKRGIDLTGDGNNVDYAFDLNEFFSTNENGEFKYKDDIKKFLRALTTQEKYPYSTPKLREELAHTLWILDRVKSAKALSKLLKEDEVFREYEIVLAAGDGRTDDDERETKAALDRVRNAIKKFDKTITLSVGQLTTGVTVPEWSGVLMLCNMKSPAQYMQAAFRAQNPCSFTKDGRRMRKETAYVFDFDPARTLVIFDEFANNLSLSAGRDTAEDREEKIRRLLNFFPVVAEDEEGRMVELDAAQVLSIPRRIKCVDVVRRGFMSNFLFQNISAIFSAPEAVTEIVKKLAPAQEERLRRDDAALDKARDISLDSDGSVSVSNEIVIGRTHDIFGDKIYSDAAAALEPALSRLSSPTTDTEEMENAVREVKELLENTIKEQIIAPAAADYEIKKSAKDRITKEILGDVNHDLNGAQDAFRQQKAIAAMERDKKLREAETEEEAKAANDDYMAAIKAGMEEFTNKVTSIAKKHIEEKPQEVVEKLERNKAENEKRNVEEEVRAHLRGFSRTIPSFLMAYGDDNLSLSNFDEYVEDDVFKEVTGITKENFRFLRDGGSYDDDGEAKKFDGGLFDETVFNDSVREFLKKKRELADYFDETKDEDIFDYIPPQKTNQIFTPRRIVKQMADELEAENPGCFDDPSKTFADLYMKSGLYITEIVKRLYRSEKMKALFPNGDARIRHILRNQVYGMAPTRIIYLIATNYILGFDEKLKDETKNFVQADAAEAAKNGTLEALVEKHFWTKE